VVRINAECISVWKSAISDISTFDGTLRQSIRWTSKEHSHFVTNALANADHSVICVKVSDTEAIHYSSNKNRSTHRHKRCSSPQDFTPAAKTWVNVTSADCILFSFSRITLQTSSPRLHLSTFERWCSKHVRWKVEPGCIRQRLTSSRCTIVVDGSFFPHIPWHISASWYVIADSAIIGSGDFITSSSKDYRSAYAAELCGVLASLQSIDNYLSKINDATMLEISVATYCLGVIRRLERHAQVTTMSTKLHPIVREVLHLNSKRFKSIDFIKLDAHQDELKSFDELSFLEKLNVKCDTRAKELILNTLEDTIVPFPLDLSSPYVMIASNQLTLNYPKDVRIHTHLLKCEIYLKKTLKITDFGTIDWALRSSIIEGVPKHLNLWLSKSLLNFAGTVHQLHRQKLCSSPIYRCCLIEPESDTLHVIDCTHNLFMNFKKILCVNL